MKKVAKAEKTEKKRRAGVSQEDLRAFARGVFDGAATAACAAGQPQLSPALEIGPVDVLRLAQAFGATRGSVAGKKVSRK